MLCCHKRILPAFPRFPVELADIYRNNEFLKDITLYNSTFSFTSLACKEIRQDQRRNYDNYRIRGRLYHLMPSVLVASQRSSSELQIYFLDDAQDTYRFDSFIYFEQIYSNTLFQIVSVAVGTGRETNDKHESSPRRRRSCHSTEILGHAFRCLRRSVSSRLEQYDYSTGRSGYSCIDVRSFNL